MNTSTKLPSRSDRRNPQWWHSLSPHEIARRLAARFGGRPHVLPDGRVRLIYSVPKDFDVSTIRQGEIAPGVRVIVLEPGTIVGLDELPLDMGTVVRLPRGERNA